MQTDECCAGELAADLAESWPGGWNHQSNASQGSQPYGTNPGMKMNRQQGLSG